MKIISGGQTGADQGALAAAKALGFTTGGWMPKEFRTDIGPSPTFHRLYGMVCTKEYDYSARTKLNIEHSDATLIFGNAYSPGCRLTRRSCAARGRPVFVVEWKTGDPPAPDHSAVCRAYEWLCDNKVSCLNVAGNRESKQPGIFEATRQFMLALLDRV